MANSPGEESSSVLSTEETVGQKSEVELVHPERLKCYDDYYCCGSQEIMDGVDDLPNWGFITHRAPMLDDEVGFPHRPNSHGAHVYIWVLANVVTHACQCNIPVHFRLKTFAEEDKDRTFHVMLVVPRNGPLPEE